jgi:hypothetical protein
MKLRIRKDIKGNPLLISILIIFIAYVILAFFDFFNIISMMGLFVFSGLFSSSLSTIIFYILYREIGITERLVNVFYSVVILMFTTNAMDFLFQSNIFNIALVNDYLIITLLILGFIYVLSYIFTTGYPIWYRKGNVLIGIIAIGFSLINFIVPLIGYGFLVVFLSTVMIINKYQVELS